jgi:hypothetical protein
MVTDYENVFTRTRCALIGNDMLGARFRQFL